MSRIGSKAIVVPAGVKVAEDNGFAVVTGKLGTLRVPLQKHISMEVTDSEVIVKRDEDTAEAKALHGLTRSLINNAVIGVVSGYKKEESEKQVFLRICPNRFIALRRLRAGIQKSHMVEKWQKEDCVAV